MNPNFPTLFVGHGSPINAIEDNEFVRGFRSIVRQFEKPKAILCISAHWQTNGTRITSMKYPKTIHDFGGFPEKLYQIQYPALGDPDLANHIKETLSDFSIEPDTSWGLDHGTWTVLMHMYPEAEIPVIQLSLDFKRSFAEHYELGKRLSFLRKKQVLILGSGNIVHNLALLDWKQINQIGFLYEWANEANETIKYFIQNRMHTELIKIEKAGKIFQLAIPTPEHYLPLLYVLALQEENEKVEFFNDKGVGGSLTMTSVKISS